jgi:AcrR family transcriptional regulator
VDVTAQPAGGAERRLQRRAGLTQAERSEETVQRLLETARELFASKGFAETSIEDIVRTAGVTRGALYHHFGGKADIFRAVVEDEAERLAQRVQRAALKKRDPWQQIEAGCREFLDACLDPAVWQIGLLDAPSVLGWQELREIDSRHSLALLHQALERAMAEGRLRERPPAPLAHLLFGALCEAGILVAGATDRRRAMREVGREVQALLRGLAER